VRHAHGPEAQSCPLFSQHDRNKKLGRQMRPPLPGCSRQRADTWAQAPPSICCVGVWPRPMRPCRLLVGPIAGSELGPRRPLRRPISSPVLRDTSRPAHSPPPQTLRPPSTPAVRVIRVPFDWNSIEPVDRRTTSRANDSLLTPLRSPACASPSSDRRPLPVRHHSPSSRSPRALLKRSVPAAQPG